MHLSRLLVAVEVVPFHFKVYEHVVNLFTAVKIGAVVVNVGEVRINPNPVPTAIERHIGIEMNLGLSDADLAPAVGVFLACGKVAKYVREVLQVGNVFVEAVPE